ncbi:MAG: sugar phosphate isomerase/epimerase family protein [Clostridia bacterium]|nr:sugar phosphate isomerase/epimerase family protein [Clostridia bacterium]
MKLSTTTSALFKCFGYEEGIRAAASAGFDALDMNLIEPIYDEEFSDEKLESTCELLRNTAEKAGICFNQSHAPFPVYSFADSEYNERVSAALERSVRAAGLIGAERIVIHPIDCPDKSTQKQFNVDFYKSLIPMSEKYGVKLALENMWGYDNINKKIIPNVCSFGRDLGDYYDALDKEHFDVCFDTGHCGLVGQSASEAIYELGGERLHALHVHDNDNINDLHAAPYHGALDWDAITKALADVGYKGDFTYEVGEILAFYRDMPKLMIKALELLAETGRYLIEKFSQNS